MAMAAREITNREAEGNPERISCLAARFSSMVFPGSKINIQLNHKKEKGNEKELFFSVLNEQEQKAIKDGYALIRN